MNIADCVSKLDFDKIKLKLCDVKEGQGWTLEYADVVELQYRKFLTLLILYPNEVFTPIGDVDEFWHQHILDTRAYASDCFSVFGHFMHHNPYLGIGGSNDVNELAEAVNATRIRWEEAFGENLSTGLASDCVKFCGGGGGR